MTILDDITAYKRAEVAAARTESSDAEIEALYYSAGHYVRLKDKYLSA